MLRSRSAWLRILLLHEGDGALLESARLDDPLLDMRVHARSRFRSVDHPARYALYSVHDADGTPPLLSPHLTPEGRDRAHTLIAVREFRRVPLDASSLALTLYTARPGRGVAVVAALAHLVERAVDVYQPGYLLLAHSLEEPATCLLLTAVSDGIGVGLEDPAGEVAAMLDAAPERYAYAPDTRPALLAGAIGPYAV